MRGLVCHVNEFELNFESNGTSVKEDLLGAYYKGLVKSSMRTIWSNYKI